MFLAATPNTNYFKSGLVLQQGLLAQKMPFYNMPV